MLNDFPLWNETWFPPINGAFIKVFDATSELIIARVP